MTDDGEGRLRADARRNRERVLRTAREAFAHDGLGVPLDEIARRAGVGPGTVHRHFPTKEALYLAVAVDMVEGIVAEARQLVAGDDRDALFTLLSAMIAAGAGNVVVKSALEAAELDLRTAVPQLAVDLVRQVADLLERARAAGSVRDDVTADDVMALVAGAFAATRHAGVEPGSPVFDRLAELALGGLRVDRGRRSAP